MAGFAFQKLQSALFVEGTPAFLDGSAMPVADTAVDVISFTTTATTTQLLTAWSDSNIAGKVEVTSDGSLIASGYTSPGNLNFSFNWLPPRPIGVGAILKVRFTARSGAPAGQQVRAYLMTTEI